MDSRRERAVTTEKKPLLTHTHFFKSQSNPELKEKDSSSSWEKLAQAIINQDIAKAKPCLQKLWLEIPARVSKSTSPTTTPTDSKSTSTSEDDLTLLPNPAETRLIENANKILEMALTDVAKKNNNFYPEDNKTSYWIMRALFHILGPRVEDLDKNLIKQLIWRKEALLKPERELFEQYLRELNVYLGFARDGTPPNPAKFFQGDLEKIVCHPLYDALRHGAHEVSDILVTKKSESPIDEPWVLPGENEITQLNPAFKPTYSLDDMQAINIWNLYVLANFKKDAHKKIDPVLTRILDVASIALIKEYLIIEKADFTRLKDIEKRGLITETNPNGNEDSACCIVL